MPLPPRRSLRRPRARRRSRPLPALALVALLAPPIGAPASESGPPPDVHFAWDLGGERGRGLAALALEPGGAGLFLGGAEGVQRRAPGGARSSVLRRRAVRDLVVLRPERGPAVLLVAAGRELWRVVAGGGAAAAGPAPGAQEVRRLAALPGLAAAATADGVYATRDGRHWVRLTGVPSAGGAEWVALQATPGGPVCWLARGGELWRGRLRAGAAGSDATGPGAPIDVHWRRVPLPARSGGGGPVDAVFDAPGAAVALVYPDALALLPVGAAGEAGGDWRWLRPVLPPGATLSRLARALGHSWLASDRGLLVAPAPSGPWRRAPAPAGGAPIRALAAAPGRLYAAGERGLLVGRPRPDPGPSAPAFPVAAPVEPGIAAVHRAAVLHLGLSRRRLESLRRGVGLRGWLPVVSVRGDLDRARERRSDFDQTFSTGAVRDLVDQSRDRSRALGVSLVATWDLADIAYHPEALDVSKEAREVIELRDDVLDEITQLYFERRRVLAELAGAPDPPAGARLRLRAEELAAGIDAWTGGWFSQQLRATGH